MNYPLFLKYRGTTIGRGFVAEISVTARLLATQDEAGWWLYGVNPSAVAADGDTLDEAHVGLRETLRLVFIDFAEEAESFEAFSARVRTFFETTNSDVTREWSEAVDLVRARRVALGDLPKVAADTPLDVTVELRRMQDMTPALNVPPIDAPLSQQGAADQYLAQVA